MEDIRIPEIQYTYDAGSSDDGWQSSGFVRTTGELPQTWELRLVRQSSAGTNVERVPLDAQARASISLAAGERGVLVVMGSTLYTTQPASYQYSVTNQ